MEYYQQTNYPLAVKLGTITADGGDVYSYDEDDMVEDPKLKEHLQHFGINISQLEKVCFCYQPCTTRLFHRKYFTQSFVNTCSWKFLFAK